ncbi:Uncharacterised protein [Shigella sonnei]|nr:Uncharacterised protein [Shigella sonnei]
MAATVVVQILAYISKKPARLKIPVSELNCTLTRAAPNNAFSIVPTAMMATEAKKKPKTMMGGLIILSIKYI